MKDITPLIHALIDAFLFLEAAGDDEVDPDSAVRCMENISASLLKLSPADQRSLRRHFEEIARNSQEPWYRKFVQDLPDMIDLEE